MARRHELGCPERRQTLPLRRGRPRRHQRSTGQIWVAEVQNHHAERQASSTTSAIDWRRLQRQSQAPAIRVSVQYEVPVNKVIRTSSIPRPFKIGLPTDLLRRTNTLSGSTETDPELESSPFDHAEPPMLVRCSGFRGCAEMPDAIADGFRWRTLLMRSVRAMESL